MRSVCGLTGLKEFEDLHVEADCIEKKKSGRVKFKEHLRGDKTKLLIQALRHHVRFLTQAINEMMVIAAAELPLLPPSEPLVKHFKLKSYIAHVAVRSLDDFAKLEEEELWSDLTFSNYARKTVECLERYPIHLEGDRSQEHLRQLGKPRWEHYLGFRVQSNKRKANTDHWKNDHRNKRQNRGRGRRNARVTHPSVQLNRRMTKSCFLA